MRARKRLQAEGDIGWVMGRIHTSGHIQARGLEAEIEWTVIGNGIEDFSENELEIWYGAQDRFSRLAEASRMPRSGWKYLPLECIKNEPAGPVVCTSRSSTSCITPPTVATTSRSICSPNLKAKNFRGIPKGIWRVRLRGEEVRDGRFDAWIERDDPMEIGREGSRRFFRFPSFFSEKSNIDSHSITSLACGQNVIAVSNLDERACTRSTSAAARDPRATGDPNPRSPHRAQTWWRPMALAERTSRWISMSGTSMASPYVTGVIGLMLAANPDLTAAQCRGILQRTARPLAGASYSWVNDMGFGKNRSGGSHRRGAIDQPAGRSALGGAMKLTIFQSDKGDCLLLRSGYRVSGCSATVACQPA